MLQKRRQMEQERMREEKDKIIEEDITAMGISKAAYKKMKKEYEAREKEKRVNKETIKE
jgi:hypothetical protein